MAINNVNNLLNRTTNQVGSGTTANASTTAQAIAEKATRGRGERRGMAVEMRRLRAGRPRISVNRTGVHGRGLIQSNIIIGYMSVNLGRVNGFCR